MEIDNLYAQEQLDEETLLHTLREQYKNDKIYTDAGLCFISINPYKDIDLHSIGIINQYKALLKNNQTNNISTHIYAIINKCVCDRARYKSILVSGESGSGKTETVKHILEYLNVPLISSINVMIETFGNAHTVNNENSSRFGKLISLGKVVRINTFLLERSRVTNYLKEYNFHIFYAVLRHHDIKIVNDYIDSINYNGKIYKTYEEIKKAFERIDVEFEPFEKIVLGIVFLGGVRIENKKMVRDDNFIKAMKYLEIEEERMEKYIMYRRIVINGEIIMKINSENESIILRDSMARLIYEEMFRILIRKINKYLKKIKVEEYKINILDIFGFEDISDGNENENGLDQFCINWCNEKIYDEFVKKTFEGEKIVLEKEGILEKEESNKIKMKKSIIEKIEGRCGIVDIISEECLINGKLESLGVKLKKILNMKLLRDDIIMVQHYAGEIKYNIKDFIKKNKEYGCLEDLYINDKYLECHENDKYLEYHENDKYLECHENDDKECHENDDKECHENDDKEGYEIKKRI